MALMASSSDELMRAEAELWCHAFGYLKSTALQCAIKLGIPNAIDHWPTAVALPRCPTCTPLSRSPQANGLAFLAS
jgi:hypothetical protein